jgi:hypothetical protein
MLEQPGQTRNTRSLPPGPAPVAPLAQGEIRPEAEVGAEDAGDYFNDCRQSGA